MRGFPATSPPDVPGLPAGDVVCLGFPAAPPGATASIDTSRPRGKDPTSAELAIELPHATSLVLAAAFFTVSVVFVYRSFCGMRIEKVA